MLSPAGTPQMRFHAHQVYYHDPAVDVDVDALHHRVNEPLDQPRNTVQDARFGRCLVWRPVEGPPLPRRFPARAAPPPSPRHHVAHMFHPSAPGRRHSAEEERRPQLQQEAEAVETGRPSPNNPSERCCVSPPRGQLLPRGKGGIDSVLKNAREAQNLFYTLQERRLKAEFRSSQHELKAELDHQREYKRMLNLAAYQEELVNLYGPAMRDVVADTFFDDGHDPVLAVLKAKREAPPSRQHASSERLLVAPDARQPSRQLWVHEECRGAATSNAAATRPNRASKERELLHRALDERRAGQRTRY